MQVQNATLASLANQIDSEIGTKERLSVGQLATMLGPRSHFTLLLIIAAAAATPISGIPGVSVVCGLLIALISLERIFNHRSIHLPVKLRERSLEARHVRAGLQKARPVIGWIDRHTKRRIEPLFHAPFVYLLLLICLLSGMAMPFLEVIPFTSSIAASGVLLIAIALVTRDGVFALLAILPYIAIAALAVKLL